MDSLVTQRFLFAYMGHGIKTSLVTLKYEMSSCQKWSQSFKSSEKFVSHKHNFTLLRSHNYIKIILIFQYLKIKRTFVLNRKYHIVLRWLLKIGKPRTLPPQPSRNSTITIVEPR